LAAVTPDGRSIAYWVNAIGSASIAADGLPLKIAALDGSAKPHPLSAAVLPSRSWVVPCGQGLLFVSGADRESTLHKRLELAVAPDYKARPLTAASVSAASPACSPDGATAAAAVSPSATYHAGIASRSIELVPTGAAHAKRAVTLTTPPDGYTDNDPVFIDAGRDLLFVQAGAPGARDLVRANLYMVDAQASATPQGPLAAVGPVGDFFGLQNWAAALAVR
jgi:hypothetical protein